MNEKRYFVIFLLVLGLLLGTAATLSYGMDPGSVFTDNTKETCVADILLSGHNVVHLLDYDERLLQKDLIKNDQRHIDVIVLGSSRSLQIHNSPLTGQEDRDQIFFNHAVSGAIVEDYIAILDLYLEKGSIPPTIIIGVDPWILNVNNGQSRWRTLKNEYNNGIARINSIPVMPEQDSHDRGFDINRYSSLLSRPVVIESINQLLNNRTSYFLTDREESDEDIKLKDGSLVYPANVRNRTVGQVDAEASNFADNDPIYSLGSFTRIDEKSKSLFESAIHYVKSRNATIILFLPPYHPIVYNKMTNDPRYSNVREAERYFRKFASGENITIIGSYDPSRMNLTSADFYDGMHPRRETVDKIFSAGNRYSVA